MRKKRVRPGDRVRALPDAYIHSNQTGTVKRPTSCCWLVEFDRSQRCSPMFETELEVLEEDDNDGSE